MSQASDVSYPLTAALPFLPITRLPLAEAGALILGISSGLLAHACLRRGEAWRLLAFASFPFWSALVFVQ